MPPVREVDDIKTVGILFLHTVIFVIGDDLTSILWKILSEKSTFTWNLRYN